MCQNTNIQVQVAFKTDRRAGNTYRIEVNVVYDPVRNHTEIAIGVSREGFSGNMPRYSYENGNCPHLSAEKIAALIEPDDLVWAQAIAVSRGNQNAKRILDGHLDDLLGRTAQTAHGRVGQQHE